MQLPDWRYNDPLVPDAAHEPALDFLPYLITGDRFYLEELEFWAEWNLSGTDPIYCMEISPRDLSIGIRCGRRLGLCVRWRSLHTSLPEVSKIMRKLVELTAD